MYAGICTTYRDAGKKILRVIPTVTNYFVIVSDISFGSIYVIYFLTSYSGILSGILSGIYSDIFSGIL